MRCVLLQNIAASTWRNFVGYGEISVGYGQNLTHGLIVFFYQNNTPTKAEKPSASTMALSRTNQSSQQRQHHSLNQKLQQNMVTPGTREETLFFPVFSYIMRA